MLVWNFILLIILLFLSAFFSGVEVALISISSVKLRTLLKEKKKGSKSLAKLKSNENRMIITILVGNNIANISASALATIIATDLFSSYGLGIAIGVMTFLVLVFGEITPKTFANIHAEKIALRVSKPILVVMKIIFPVIVVFEWITTTVLKMLGKSKKTSFFSEEYLKTAIDIVAEQRFIEHGEKRLLKKVLELNDITAKEVMTPKRNWFVIDANMKIKDAIPIISTCPFSRIPLVEGKNKDKVIGIIHLKDVLEAITENELELQVKEISVKPSFVPDTLEIDEIFKLFQEKHRHIAFVRNKHKRIIGLITFEDLLEELVGEIIDESDVSPNKMMRLAKNKILVDGETNPFMLKSFFNIYIPKKFEDLSDFLIRHNKGLPRRGQRIRIRNVTYTIEEVGVDFIERVVITKR